MSPRLVVRVRGHLERLPLSGMRPQRNEGVENTRAWRAMIASVTAEDSARKLRMALMEARLRSERDADE